ncbi:MAG: hypothetical protein HFI72_06420 [Peptococcaceae bacterium]|nr:hypothetical protein [Peptococcaceae bacterium]
MAFTLTAGNDSLTTALYEKLENLFYQEPFAGEITAVCKLKIELLSVDGQKMLALWTKRTMTEMEFQSLRNALAGGLYGFVRETAAMAYLKERLFSGYGELLPAEKEQVYKILSKEINQYWEYGRANHVLARLPELLSDYLAEASHLHLQGFLRFRLPEYLPLLAKTIDRAIERYTIEKEYDAFIDLIQAFIQTQKSKISLVHVVWGKNHCYRLLDEKYLPLEQDFWQQAEGIAVEGAYDDVLISSLLYLLPEKIILHTGCERQAPKIALTIQKIFSGRAMLCAGCKVCKETMQQSQK